MVDSTRAAIVTQPYRYTRGNEDSSILAIFPTARAIQLDTNLDEAGAVELATDLFSAVKEDSRTFTLTFEGALFAEDFISSPPRYLCVFSLHPEDVAGTIYTVISASSRPRSNRTTVTVRS